MKWEEKAMKDPREAEHLTAADKLHVFTQRIVSEREMARRERDLAAMVRNMRGDPS